MPIGMYKYVSSLVFNTRWKSKTYKDQPFVPVVQAPRVMLIVYDDVKVSKTSLLVETIFSAWPFLLFILALALLAGLVIWMLVSTMNIHLFQKSLSPPKATSTKQLTTAKDIGTFSLFIYSSVDILTTCIFKWPNSSKVIAIQRS